MELKHYCEWVEEAWKRSSKKVTERDEILFLLEEIGEMAEAMRKRNGNKENKDFEEDLEKEFGDVLLSIITLALRYKICLEKAFLKTKKSIEKRYVIR